MGFREVICNHAHTPDCYSIRAFFAKDRFLKKRSSKKMACSSFHLVIGLWLLPALTFSSTVHALTRNACPAIETNSPTKNTALFRVENGLVDLKIDKAPLGTILDRFQAEFDLQVKLYDPSLACSLVSIDLKGTRPTDAIKGIMKSISYALYPEGNSLVVIILSDDELSTSAHGNITGKPKPTTYSPSIKASKATQEPQSLDEFQPITMGEQENTDPSEQLKTEQKYQDALVQRALAAIDSGYESLREEAMSELIGVNDPLATETLINATRNGTDSISRAHAVDTLRQHLENLQYTDAVSIEALEQLAGDSDQNVSNIALQALQELDKFQAENRSQNY